MSLDKNLYEARRWLETAGEDLDAARALLEKEKFSHACFFAQQCGEKSLKALYYSLGEDPWGHSIQKLIEELPEDAARVQLRTLLEDGAVLDRYYIPTRYPNGLPDLTPGQAYFRRDAELCIDSGQRLLDMVTASITPRGN
jgi:HEPN domain-containing protein